MYLYQRKLNSNNNLKTKKMEHTPEQQSLFNKIKNADTSAKEKAKAETTYKSIIVSVIKKTFKMLLATCWRRFVDVVILYGFLKTFNLL
jgi:hypothetical protein